MTECMQCGECCRTLSEVKITYEEYALLKEYGDPQVTAAPDDRLLMSLPCIFQKDNKCTVWKVRPCMCRMWHCGKKEPDDKIVVWVSDIRALMDKDEEYRAYKIKQENEAVEWGNRHGWEWKR